MAEEMGDSPSCSLTQIAQVGTEMNPDSIPPPAIDVNQEVESTLPMFHPLLEYIEARQQVLLCNISYCNRMLELLEEKLPSVNEPYLDECEEQQDTDQATNQVTEDPGEVCCTASVSTQLACNLN
ncbi:uncharacterized protein LOC144606672 [Rhinoraja longicauda]